MQPPATSAPRVEPPARWRLPGQCAVCRSWCGGALCRPCRERHAAPVPRCPRCGLRAALPPAPGTCCAACLADPPPFARCVCAVDYAFPWDRLVTQFKFEGRLEWAGPLADLLQRAVVDAGGDRPDLVLPVPLAPRRLAQRGYNQAWEIARRVARSLRVAALADALQRPGDGAHQAELPLAQRLQNVRHAFYVPPAARPRLHGRHLALVDDVMTSGATAGAAARALRQAGAARVDLWMLARTPAPDG